MDTFDTGRVIGTSLSVWIRNIVAFAILSLLVYAPLLIYTVAVVQGPPSLKAYETWDRIDSIAGMLLQYVLIAAVSYGVFKQLKGEPASFGETIAVGLKRLLPALGVGIVTGLIIGLGTLALIVPGLILATVLYVAVPVSVIERSGVGDSLSRSSQLTKGYRWQIFAIVFFFGVITIGGGMLLAAAFGVLSPQTVTLDQIHSFMLVQGPVLTLLGSLAAVASAVTYFELVRAKEGADIDELVAVFE